jgi:glycosyltransferase involved in cell wall biosynthesis
MRILMLSSSYPKYPGETTAPFIEEIAAGLAARGHHIDLLAPWHPDVRRGPLERGVHLHFFRYAPHPALNVWGYAQSLQSDTLIKQQTLAVTPFALGATVRAMLRVLHREFRAQTPPFDIVHAHWLLPNAVPAALVAWSVRLPLVVSLHGSDVYLAEHYWPTTPLAGLAFRAAAAVTACSRDLHWRGLRLGAPPQASHVVPYGINSAEFQPNPQARAAVHADLGLPDDVPLVLALGRLVYKKGFHVLLDAWPHVLAHHPRAVLVLVGYGDLRESLEQQAARLGIAQQVRFTGQLERQRAATYLAAADVFALPIVRDQGTDGLPNTLLEAMGTARPVVASRVAGVPDVLTDGEHGLTVPERDPFALAAAIVRLLDDPALAERLGAAARQRIEQELTWKHTAARFEHVLEQARERL